MPSTTEALVYGYDRDDCLYYVWCSHGKRWFLTWAGTLAWVRSHAAEP